MSPPGRPTGAGVALTATLAIQIFVSLVATAAAVLAPEVAQTFSIAPKWIGVFVSLIYVGAMFASLASGGVIQRYGAIRVSQACVILCVAGSVLVVLAPDRAVVLLVIAALVIGIGYGPITPASSHVLVRTATPSNFALTFSIKQTGVPAGAALAGAILPGLALALGWRNAFVAMAIAGLVVVAGAQAVRATLDADRIGGSGWRFSPAGVFAPLALVRRSRALTELTLIGLCYAATQVCLMSFLVVYLTEALGWTLVAAGLALTVTTLGGVAGRIVWGWAADRMLKPRRVLGMLGTLPPAASRRLRPPSGRWPDCSPLAAVSAAPRSAEWCSSPRSRGTRRRGRRGDGSRRLHHVRVSSPVRPFLPCSPGLRAATAWASRIWRNERLGRFDAPAAARTAIGVNGTDFHDSVNFAGRCSRAGCLAFHQYASGPRA